ncbi:hypothetical protein TRIUR3_24683 [Triticum urartu]|uniref:Non-haem dioxygenase N-terminal domain-containing protein n=1 Tax=Triticum urartu TaxID=4572 RepID=M7ZBW6_TRIUA|nr:hypothetical protein TRIUR3_24683 [Triticum urartu]
MAGEDVDPKSSAAASVVPYVFFFFLSDVLPQFLLSNHGVETSLMDGTMIASREFFKRPLEDKKRYTNLIGGEQFQFEGYGNDRVRSPDQILDWPDCLYLKGYSAQLHKKCGGVKDDLLRAMAKLLQFDDDDYFVDQLGEKAETNVVTNAKKERLSVAVDYSVDHEREIEPWAQLIDKKRPALYMKVKVKDYIAGLYEHFSQGTMVIDTLQI